MSGKLKSPNINKFGIGSAILDKDSIKMPLLSLLGSGGRYTQAMVN